MSSYLANQPIKKEKRQLRFANGQTVSMKYYSSAARGYEVLY